MQRMTKIARRVSPLLLVGAILVGCQINPPAQPSKPPAEPSRPIPPPTPQLPATPPPVDKGRSSNAPVVAPTGGSTTYYQDRQEQYLRGRLDSTGLRLSREGDVLKIVVPGAGFAINSDQLQPRIAQALDTIAPVVKEFSKTTIEIKGYTDSTGSFEHNQNLSERRAQSVGAYLAARQVPIGRIHTAGFGPRSPVADNRTDSGRMQNRRVEIDLVPAS